MFRLQKCRFSNAIVPLLHTNSATITHQKRRYWKTRASFLRQNTIKTAWQLSRIKILFVIHFYCLYDICITCKTTKGTEQEKTKKGLQYKL